MSKKIITITLIMVILASTFMLFGYSAIGATTDPVNMKIFFGPTKIPADNTAYNCIFVQLQDSTGKPARALQDTTISLSSSLTSIGQVDETLVIPKSATYASANFHTTFSPSTTTITASASGFPTQQGTLTTVGPIPSSIALYGLPPTLPSDGRKYGAIMVQLQDTNGYPAKAPEGGVSVVLSTSNAAIGTITSPVIIEKDQTYTIADFTTTATPGTTVLTPVVTGYTVKNTLTITTQAVGVGGTGQRLQVYTAPVPADKTTHRPIAVLLQNSAGEIISEASDLTINLGSSAPDIGTTQAIATLRAGEVYVMTDFAATYKAGTTTITAAATGYASATKQITTFGFTPTKLVVYNAPPSLPSDNKAFNIIHVQLQDSQGRPARAPESPVSINMSSSDPTIGNPQQAVTITVGGTQAVVPFTVTNAPGAATITAQASGYTSGTAQVTTHLIDYSPLQVSVTSRPTSTNNGNNTQVSAYVTADGSPVTGATVTFTSNNGGKFSAVQQENGYYNATFTAPNFSQTASCTITASVKKTGYLDGQGTTQITVSPTGTTNPEANNATNAIIKFHIENATGPLKDVTIISTSAPTGAKTLSGITDANGNVTFTNVSVNGNYTFTISRIGYISKTEIISFQGQPITKITFLPVGSAEVAEDNSLILIIIAVVVVAVVVSVVSIVLIRRRSGNSRIKKLQELQRQIKTKY